MLSGETSRADLGLFRAARPAHTQFAQDDFQRAKTGEGGLEQIESDESGKPKPIGAVIVSQHKADENKSPGESANDHFHKIVFLNLVQTGSSPIVYSRQPEISMKDAGF